MIFEMALADAYGVGFEFVDHSADRPNDLSVFHKHPAYQALPAGCYTDDTQRAIANAEVILGSGDIFNPATYTAQYQAIYKADPREGYSRRYQKYLTANLGTEPAVFMMAIRRRPTNGALMGVAPLGFLPTPGAVKLATAVQVITTHHGAATPWAEAIALSAHFLLRGGTRADLMAFLKDTVDWADDTQFPRLLNDTGAPVTMQAHDTASAIIAELLRNDQQSAILKACIERGGDTDSVAAGAIALAACSSEIEADLPGALQEGFEDPKQRSNLRNIDALLVRRFIQ